MRTFTTQNSIDAVKRLTYSGTPSKGTLSTVYTGLTGYLRALDPEAAAVNNMQFGFAFSLITEQGIDIQIGDTLTIDGTDYNVKGVADYTAGNRRTSYLKFLLTKPTKA